MLAHIPWRRRDLGPEAKNLIVVDAATGKRITNVMRIAINREYGDLVFEPRTVPGVYYVYYLPYVSTGGSYPRVSYPPPEETADGRWLRQNRLLPEALAEGAWRSLPRAVPVAMQSIDGFNSFWPMEVIATGAEVRALEAAYPEASFLVFPEDRKYPIRMYDDLPLRWIEAGPGGPFRGEAMRGEFYAFQLGVYAVRSRLEDLRLVFGDLTASDGTAVLPAGAFRCFNLSGVDWTGRAFTREVTVEQGRVQPLWCGVQIPESARPGVYRGTLEVSAAGREPVTIELELTVTSEVIEAAGDDEPWRHSRLRWLDSRIATDDGLVRPYTPVELRGKRVNVLGRSVLLDRAGFPEQIVSFFAPEMTRLVDEGRELLAAPITLEAVDANGEVLSWHTGGMRVVKRAPGVAAWESSSTAGALSMELHAEIEFDGTLEYTVALSASERIDLEDIRLRIPMARDAAVYMMGMGRKGGLRPSSFDWTWDVGRNQDGAWVGDVNAGLQFSMRDEKYSRPLNTNFYHSRPLVMPSSWSNGGRGGSRMRVEGDAWLITSYSGPRTMRPGRTLYYNFRLAITPFRPIDTDKQWRTRFFHDFRPVEEVAATGANTINVHHGKEINPYINYPFLRPAEMKAYIDEAHARGMKVKIYYTVRELSNRAPELFALRSLGEEILSYGPGGGFSWLQEHLGSGYIAGWFVPPLKDAAVINSGVSRWHNYYLEGLNWLVKNVGIDGLYIDDVAFDRTIMKRVRKILDRGRPEALIDLHSANQFNERDGFANSANLYLEHFPYIDRLWFGEYFDYDSTPDYWLIEVSGIPFGLMGEMLQGGGNPWRGMLYGMTSRLPYGGNDPSPLWRAWDAFGIRESRMIGYWVPDAPVTTGRDDVLATTWVAKGKAMVAVASWAGSEVAIRLNIDWEALGIDPAGAMLTAPAIDEFQEARRFRPGDAIPVPPGKGWLLILEERGARPALEPGLVPGEQLPAPAAAGRSGDEPPRSAPGSASIR